MSRNMDSPEQLFLHSNRGWRDVRYNLTCSRIFVKVVNYPVRKITTGFLKKRINSKTILSGCLYEETIDGFESVLS